MAEALLVAGGHVVGTSSVHRADVLVVDGKIAAVGTSIEVPAGTRVLDAAGCWVGPGLVDLHTHLREPGGEEAETVASGSWAAVAGGYTAVVAMPNTMPAADCAAVVAQVIALGRDTPIDVLPAGAITVAREGAKLAPMAEMAALGVTIFTDDGTGVQDAGLMRRAMEYAHGLGVTLAEHCEDESLAAGGCMNESALSARLGLVGRPAIAEEAMVARDLLLAEITGCSLHLLHLSTARSVALVTDARAAGVAVTAEVAPHHLTLTEELCADFDTVFKVHPPLRGAKDVEALREALADGRLDAVATDHAPHSPQAKDRPFDEAAPGMLGLETAIALSIEALGGPDADPVRVFEVLSRAPSRIAGLTARDERRGGFGSHGGSIEPGEDANLCVLDPAARPVVDPAALQSRSSNTPYAGRTLLAGVRHTVAKGLAVKLDGEVAR
jgi:dihydroorotase